MLKRRAKRRYLSILHAEQANDAVNAIAKRCSELFGSVGTEKAAIRLVKSEGSTTIIKCRLDQLDNVLVAIALADPPVVTMDMSGSIKRLQRR
ncbi:MAG TPA: Rpp14/Pop5 family protein [Nitrososphaera sp.]|nr:Rpp14/Pop5 family protein [Nitrososphaera sp.]